MKTFPPQKTRQKLVTFLFGMIFIAVMAACGTSAESAGTVAVTSDEVTATNSDGVAAATAPVDRREDNEDNEANAENAADVADERPATVDVDKSPNGRGDDAGNTNQEALQTQDNDSDDAGNTSQQALQTQDNDSDDADSREPEPAPAADNNGDAAGDDEDAEADTSDTDVPAIARNATTYECPAGTTGNPSHARPLCTREEVEIFPTTPTTQVRCPPRHRFIDDVCVPTIADELRFTYECPRANNALQPSHTTITSNGTGPGLTCTASITQLTQPAETLSCGPGDTLEGRREFRGVTHAVDIDLCIPAPEMFDAVLLEVLFECPSEWVVAPDPEGEPACGLPTEVVVPAVDKSCSEGQAIEADDGAVTSCVVVEYTFKDVTEIEVYGCPDDVTSVNVDGRQQCVVESEPYLPTIERTCPPGIELFQNRCAGTTTETQVDPIANPCPEGQAAQNVDRNICSEIFTETGTPTTVNECPANATKSGSECSIVRTVEVAATETTTVEYSCPGGSTGQPTANDPFCQKNT